MALNTKSKRRAANAAKDSPRASSTENARASTASSSSKSLVPSTRRLANSRGKSRSVAYATQCTGFSGVSRRVHMGCDLGVGLGEHSKHASMPLPS